MKVFVGLSGGVDSSVAAALLKDQGHEVVGVYMKNWSRDVAGHHCPWEEDLASARSVTAHLQIPLKVYDFEKEYYESVTNYMIETYKKGLTPNPDIICNQEIKFKVFLQKCLDDGAEKIATGHYAQLKKDCLAEAKDANKDQTYFLYRMDPAIAAKVLFPVGKYTKPEVRALAQKFDLPTATRHDSQGLCFVGNVPMKDFLGEFIKSKPGDIVDEHGTKLGEHNGAFSYTIGQRHGLGVGGGKPYFVYNIDTVKNIVYVTNDKDSQLLYKSEFYIDEPVWWQQPELNKQYGVQIRYRSAKVHGELEQEGKKYKVVLQNPAWAITPGQSAVIYNKTFVVGGGVIV